MRAMVGFRVVGDPRATFDWHWALLLYCTLVCVNRYVDPAISFSRCNRANVMHFVELPAVAATPHDYSSSQEFFHRALGDTIGDLGRERPGHLSRG
jgi:hypothetical protein